MKFMGGGVLKWSLFMFEFEDNFLVLGFGGVVWEGGVFFFLVFIKLFLDIILIGLFLILKKFRIFFVCRFCFFIFISCGFWFIFAEWNVYLFLFLFFVIIVLEKFD